MKTVAILDSTGLIGETDILEIRDEAEIDLLADEKAAEDQAKFETEIAELQGSLDDRVDEARESYKKQFTFKTPQEKTLVEQPDGLVFEAGGTWNFDNGSYTPPPPPSEHPEDYPLNRIQFMAMLKMSGKEADVLAALAAMPDSSQDEIVAKAVAQSKFENSAEFNRDDPLFAALGSAVGLSDDDIDTLWMQARDIG